MNESYVSDQQSIQTSQKCSYNDIAGRLLRDKLYLTALELHTELTESGREVQQLKDYFSNPGNFEGQYDQQPTKMSRSGSQQTLDSLDLTRYSEDGDRAAEEHVAVLEFELRKARETINALRNNLTVVTESETPMSNSPSTKPAQVQSDIIKPHERRALNFLINEYMLLQGYKLTSITFADENEDQDFEDWDDVGLNIAKPAELLIVYRDSLKQQQVVVAVDKEDGCGIVEVVMVDMECQTDEIEEVEVLKSKSLALETKIQLLESQLTEVQSENALTITKQNSTTHCPLESVKYSESISSKNSYSSSVDSPEKFEIIDKTKATKANESNSDFDWTNVNIEGEEHAENVSENSSSNNPSTRSELLFQYCDMSSDYMTSLSAFCPMRLQDNELFLSLNATRVTSQHLVQAVSESLLKIIPNIILAKREEVISLLVYAVILQQDVEVRDKLLQQLFSLKKKPSDAERLLILSGIVGIAQNAKSNLVENELLPQCWEQIAHKHVERRLLIAEACRYLIPYISATIRNSLLLSMVQQLMEDRSALVRDSVVQSLAIIIALCSDVDKYTQCEQLTFAALTDDSVTVVNHITDILFPVLAKWALDNGLFASHLIKKLLQYLSDSLRNPKEESHNDSDEASHVPLRYIKVLSKLLPFVVMYVAANDRVLEGITGNKSITIRPELLMLCSDLSNPNIFYTGKFTAGQILARFDELLEEDSSFLCPQLEWIIDIMLPELLNSLTSSSTSNSSLPSIQHILSLFTNLCHAFGSRFVRVHLRPLFGAQIASMEQIIANNVSVTSTVQQTCGGALLVLLPVYLVAVVCNSGGGDTKEEVGTVVRRFLYALPVCGVPVDSLEVSVIALSCHSIAICDVVLAALWEGVVHVRPLVRATTVGLFAAIIAHCAEDQLSSKLVPALVTLACDTDLFVRMAAIPALGRLITDCQLPEIHDKSYMQLQIYLSDTSIKDNHTLLRQLVVTLGNVVTICKPTFRNEVILPQLSSITTSLLQTTNLTRKIDMATALIEAYVNTIYSPLQSNYIATYVLPGLKNLEQIVLSNPPLRQHLDSVRSMLRETENRADLAAMQQRAGAGDVITMSSPGAGGVGGQGRMSIGRVQGVEEMRQKVSKLFQTSSAHTAPTMVKSNTLSNIQGLFKKK